MDIPQDCFLPGGRFTLPGAPHGPLAGLTFAAKDLFDVAGHPTGGGNPDWARQNPVPTRHAQAVQMLLDAGCGRMSRPSGPEFHARPLIHTIPDAERRSGLNLVLTLAGATMVAAIEAGVPALATARDLISEFHRMIRATTPALLQAWTKHAEAS